MSSKRCKKGLLEKSPSKDMFKSKRRPLEEIWVGGHYQNIAQIARFAPSACNTQPWIVESGEWELKVYRYQKPGKRGIMPSSKVSWYNRIDIGIFLLFLEVCMEHECLAFERTLYADTREEEKTLVCGLCGKRKAPHRGVRTKEITLDRSTNHFDDQGLFLFKGGFHLWLTSLSSDLEIT